MEAFRAFQSTLIPLLENDIDTDQIIPARYLKVTDKHGLGANLFADWRYAPDGAPKPDFILNQESCRGAQILLAGENFGCGSSREHAPWALLGYGIRAVIAISFADIFSNNALKNGLLPVAVSADFQQRLATLVAGNPAFEVEIDLQSQTLGLPDGLQQAFSIDPFSRRCLLEGVDQLGYLLSFTDQILEFEANHAAYTPD
jgi:3-isopropylmalate/(R)-2-methylmalate dehydratase small subunit